MGTRYTEGFKKQAVEKALNRGEGTAIRQIAADLDVSASILYAWIGKAKKHDVSAEGDRGKIASSNPKRPQDWSLEDRLNMVTLSASLDDASLNKLCREQGIYPHHIKQWKIDFTHGKSSQMNKNKTPDTKKLKEENKRLKKELRRKEKALAEAAALLILQKKVSDLWGESEVD